MIQKTMQRNSKTTAYARLNKVDPTRTTALRQAFVRDLNKRFRAFRGVIRKAILERNCFGYPSLDKEFKVVTLAASDFSLPGRKAFAFPRSEEKVNAFMNWLQGQEAKGILEVGTMQQIGTPIETAWTNKYIKDSYQRGVQRARWEMKSAGYKVPPISETGGISASMSTPFHMDRVGVLYTRVFQELKGITSQMDTQISRVLSQGIADGKHPTELAKLLTRTISGPVGDLGITDTLGRFIPAERRAQTLARTEVIRAHHQGNIQEMKNWAVEGVKVKAEWVTAGYNVCPECAALEGKVFSLDEIQNMIPVHPNCFLDPQTLVYTSTGWRSIGSIQIGDYVLTHKGRFRKVYALPRNKGLKGETEVVRFSVLGMGQGGLSMTANHPVLITKEGCSFSRWKEAGKVKKTEQIRLLANRCKRCNALIPYFRDYCSQTCVSKDVTDRQWADPKHRENMSKKAHAQLRREYISGIRDKNTITIEANKTSRQLAKKGKWVLQRPDVREIIRQVTNTPEMRKASSERMKKNNPMHDPVVKRKALLSIEDYLENHPEKRLNARMAKYRKSGKKTWIEERMAILLDKIGVNYVFQYPILRYNVDFAIPALKIAIECDGEYWHQDKEKDAIRQKRIEQEGWFVLRYTGAKINQCLEEIEEELSRVLMNHSGRYEFVSFSIQKIEHWKLRKNRRLYNLSVEGDESYLAKGMVVHNCRCVAIPVKEEEDIPIWTTGMPWEEDQFEKMASQLHLKVKKAVLDEKFTRDYVVLDRDVFVYHGVGKENLQSVLKSGIRPSTHPGNARGVYFGSKELGETWRGKGKTVAVKVRIPAGTRLYADVQPNAVFVRRAVPTSWLEVGELPKLPKVPKTIPHSELFGPKGRLDIRSLDKDVQKEVDLLQYDSTNNHLRFGGRGKDESKEIDAAFKKHGISLDGKVVGYRGVEGTPYPMKEGEVFTDKGYFRFSGSKWQAGNFVPKEANGQFVTIKIPPGQKMLPGDSAWEEVYLPRNQKFRVLSTKKTPNGHYFDSAQREWMPAWKYEIEIEPIVSEGEGIIPSKLPKAPRQVSEIRFKRSDDVDGIKRQLREKYNIFSIVGKENLVRRYGNLVGETIGNDIYATFPDFAKKANSVSIRSILLKDTDGGKHVNTFAQYSFSSRRLTCFGKSMIRTNPSLTVGVGKHNVGLDFKTVIRHEYGHHIYRHILGSVQRKEIQNLYNALGKEYVKKKISLYASTNASEFFSEIFAAFTSPKYSKGTLPKKVEEVLFRIMGERG